MVVKELIEARWKAITCGLLALVLVEASAATYDLLRPVLSNTSSLQMPQFLQQQVQQLTSSYSLYVWGNWFAKNGTEILAVLAAVLGAGLIAGEVSKGTIFLLLGKPISRERALLNQVCPQCVDPVCRDRVEQCGTDNYGSNCWIPTAVRRYNDLNGAALAGCVVCAGPGTAVLGTIQRCVAAFAVHAGYHHPGNHSRLLPELGHMEFAWLLVQPGSIPGPVIPY